MTGGRRELPLPPVEPDGRASVSGTMRGRAYCRRFACLRGFATPAERDAHERRAHAMASGAVEARRDAAHACRECGAMLGTLQARASHEAAHRRRRRDGIPPAAQYACERCHVTFVHEGALRDHQRSAWCGEGAEEARKGGAPTVDAGPADEGEMRTPEATWTALDRLDLAAVASGGAVRAIVATLGVDVAGLPTGGLFVVRLSVRAAQEGGGPDGRYRAAGVAAREEAGAGA